MKESAYTEKHIRIPKARFFRTETGHRNFGLDLARFIIVVSVVLFHCNNYLDKYTGAFKVLTPMAYIFQELLFGLSGFLVGRQLMRYVNKNTALRPADFYRNRWLRTLPFYFIFLLLNTLLFYLVYRPSGGFFVQTDFSLWKYVLCVQNLFIQHPYFFPEIWPVPLEEWSYLLIPFPLFIAVALRKEFKLKQLFYTLIAFAVLGNFLRVAHICSSETLNTDWDIRKIVVYRLDALVYGFMICLLMEWKPDFFKKIKWTGLTTGLLMGFGFYMLKDSIPLKVYQSLVFFVFPFSMAITIPWFYSTDFSRLYAWIRSFITHISLISYSVLLMHLYFIQFLMLQLYIPDSLAKGILFTAFYLFLVVVFSTLFFNYVERPVLLKRKRII